jgi:hypothetical protein
MLVPDRASYTLVSAGFNMIIKGYMDGERCSPCLPPVPGKLAGAPEGMGASPLWQGILDRTLGSSSEKLIKLAWLKTPNL